MNQDKEQPKNDLIEENPSKEYDLYTCITREPKGYMLMQECGKKIILQTKYKLDQLPFIALRFNRVDGMDYGRGHCESYLGDLKSLEGLTTTPTIISEKILEHLLITSMWPLVGGSNEPGIKIFIFYSI